MKKKLRSRRWIAMLLMLMLLMSSALAESEPEQPPSSEVTEKPAQTPEPQPTPEPEPAKTPEPEPEPTAEPTPVPATETPGGQDETPEPGQSTVPTEDVTPVPTQDAGISPAPSDSPGTDTTPEPGSSPDAGTSPGPDGSTEPDVTLGTDTQTPPPEETPAPKGLKLLPRLPWSTFWGITPGGDEGLKVPILYQTDYTDAVCTVDDIDRSVATSGCGATCASMVIAYLTGNTEQTPYTLFYDAVEAGHYKGDGLGHEVISWLLNSHGVKCKWVSESESAIRDALEAGKPVIAHMGSGIFTEGGHYIVLRGITGDGKLLVNDPNSSANTNTTFGFDVILSQTRSTTPLLICWVGDGTPKAKATPEPSPQVIGDIGRLPLPIADSE